MTNDWWDDDDYEMDDLEIISRFFDDIMVDEDVLSSDIRIFSDKTKHETLAVITVEYSGYLDAAEEHQVGENAVVKWARENHYKRKNITWEWD